jgi:acetyltransferase-like isoleucine patch superfamily enzyme
MHAVQLSQSFPGAYVSLSAHIGKGVKIAPMVYIADGVVLGDGVAIEPGAVIYENVRLGARTVLGAQCVLGERLADHLKSSTYLNPPLEIGEDSIIRSGSIIYAGCIMGSRFQTGNRALIREYSMFGNGCSFGAMSQSDGQIKVGNDCRFHNNVFIATYTTIEDNVHFYPMSCTVDSLHPPCQKGREGPHFESNVIVGAKALILPRVRVGKNSVIAGASVVTHDVPAEAVVAGAPARVLRNRAEVRCHVEDRPAYEVALER